MTEAQVQGAVPAGPMTIADGRVAVGAQLFEGVLPLPFEAAAEVRLEIDGVGGTSLRATAEGIRVNAVGKARFVEEFPGEA